MFSVVVQYILTVLVIWALFVQVVMRLIRRYRHFPIPAFIARYIDNPVRRRIQPPSKVINWMNIRDEMYVLEVGCGPGTFTLEAANHALKGIVLAIDIQSSLIMRLRSRLKRAGVNNVEPVVASVYNLPFLDEVFDRAFMIAVIGELPQKETALLEIRRVLKDDGLLAIGEFLPDPDCPLKRTVINWAKKAGFELIGRRGGILHYLLLFRKASTSSSTQVSR
ncbi:MAG: dimethylmenaquinone methyltransferase [Thermoprotei archaeon]|nr:MAG: dimethylmenaquinone methyltransferase [Thermoprotei archaeon]RLF25022.1 MAG: dimethylmenaquinone methyltransferase [Thermoprotei archaeon]